MLCFFFNIQLILLKYKNYIIETKAISQTNNKSIRKTNFLANKNLWLKKSQCLQNCNIHLKVMKEKITENNNCYVNIGAIKWNYGNFNTLTQWLAGGGFYRTFVHASAHQHKLTRTMKKDWRNKKQKKTNKNKYQTT